MAQDTPDISVDKAELVSMLLESIVYGFSLLMFGATVWSLVVQRSADRVNRMIVAVACSLLLFSTAHLAIDIIRIINGLIRYRNTFRGGPIAYFSDPSQWTSVYKDYTFVAQTLIGDGVVLYRCYVVWQSKLVIILPTLLWCGVGVTGVISPYIAQRNGDGEVFGWSLAQWMTSFYALTLITNLLTTLLLAYRIWYLDHNAAKSFQYRKSRLRPTLYIIIDAGMIYSFTLLAELICFSSKSNCQCLILDMITPIISITFYMVIIRVGLANWASHSMNTAPSGYPSTVNRFGAGQRHSMQVHITRLTEYAIESRRRSSLAPIASENGGSSIRVNNGGDAV